MGRQIPDHIRFLTYTTRYNRDYWVTLDGLEKHYDRAEVDAKRSDDRAQYDITTKNLTRLVLRRNRPGHCDQHRRPEAEREAGARTGVREIGRNVEAGEPARKGPAQEARPAGTDRRCVSGAVPGGASDRDAVERGGERAGAADARNVSSVSTRWPIAATSA